MNGTAPRPADIIPEGVYVTEDVNVTGALKNPHIGAGPGLVDVYTLILVQAKTKTTILENVF